MTSSAAILALVASLAFAFVGQGGAMERCLERASFDTCHSALNR